MLLPALPHPDAEAVLVSKDGAQTGPMSRRALSARLGRGEVAETDHFFFTGMSDWAVIGDHPAVRVDDTPADESPTDRLERLFGGLVKDSWAYHDTQLYASQVDELLLGAVITSTLDNDYALIDLSSDGTHHYVRFQHAKDQSRILCRLTHLTADPTRAKVQGHRASVIIGYGERMDDFARIFQALRAEVKSGYLQNAAPGTLVVDGDMNTGYIYVQVDLYLEVDNYIGSNYEVNYPVLKDHLAATLHTLRKYLRGRFAK